MTPNQPAGTRVFHWDGGRSAEERERIFQERADALRRRPARVDETAGEGIVAFRLGAGRYGVPLGDVTEALVRVRLALVPGAPPEVAGLIQVRGEICVVWDLRSLLNLPAVDMPESGAVLMLHSGKTTAAVRVGELEDIQYVREEDRQPPPEQGSASAAAIWMTTDLVIVLDLKKLLAHHIEETHAA